MIRFAVLMAFAMFAWFGFSYLMGFPRLVDVAAVMLIAGVVTYAERRLT